MEDIMSKEEILDLLKELATPVDFDGLIADGVLRKSGAWFILLKPGELPQHAWRHAYAMQSGKGQMRCKFRNSSKGTEALYTKIAGEAMAREQRTSDRRGR